MQRRVSSLWLLLLAFALSPCATLAQQQAPASRPAVAGKAVVRLSNGKPDMSGNWALAANLNDISADIVSIGGNKPSASEKKIPYTPVYAKLRSETGKRMYEEPELHCYMPGVPSHMWRQAYSGAGLVVQHNDTHIVFTHEFQGARRIVSLTGNQTLPDQVKLFMGHGTGKWEGDTLVITTTNHNAITWLDLAGNRHSDKLVVTERFTPIDNDNYRYQASFEDPIAYTQPWAIESTMKRGSNPDAEILEFACVEGNTDDEHYTEEVGGKSTVEK